MESNSLLGPWESLRKWSSNFFSFNFFTQENGLFKFVLYSVHVYTRYLFIWIKIRKFIDIIHQGTSAATAAPKWGGNSSIQLQHQFGFLQ